MVLNLVLVGALLLRTPDVPSNDAADPGPTAEDTSTASPEDDTSAPPSPSDAGSDETPTTGEDDTGDDPGDDADPTLDDAVGQPPLLSPADRFIVGATAWVAWRGTVGDCTAPGTLEHTTDGGQSWQAVESSLAPLTRVRVLGEQSLFAIGGGADCEATYRSSSTSGASWFTNDDYLAGSWYLLPSDRTQLATPVGQIDTPCSPVELAALDASNAAVLCTDGTLAHTTDGGASWQEATPLPGARALGAAADGYVLAGTDEQCDQDVAVLFTDVTGAASAEQPACAPAALDAGTELAVAANAGTTWLWAGEEVLTSPDGGSSW